MRWLGLDWDEGPVSAEPPLRDVSRRGRSTRSPPATPTSASAPRTRSSSATRRRCKAGRPPGYDGRCRDLTADERAARVAEGRPRSVRFRTPDEGRSTFTDVVRGEVSVEWSTISDFVIVRSNGTPVFFLANAVDDIDMNITHVLRGEDLIDSTHRVLALRRALGDDDQPVYAHLPMILGAGRRQALEAPRRRCRSRSTATLGYLPHALVNYLALLGWGPEDGREVLTVDELVAEFDVDAGHAVGCDVRRQEARVDER